MDNKKVAEPGRVSAALERKLLTEDTKREENQLSRVNPWQTINVKETWNKRYLFSLKDLNYENAKTHGGSLRLLRIRAKDVQTSGCHLARGVWPGL